MKINPAQFGLPSLGLAVVLSLAPTAQPTVADEVAGPPEQSQAKETATKTAATRQPSSKQDEPRFRGLAPEQLLQNRSHDVILDENGGFSGRLLSVTADGLVPAANMQVQLLSRGQQLGSTTTDANGVFTVSGLKPKQVVAIFGSGPSGIVVYGARLIAATEKNPATREIDLESALVEPPNVGVATEIMGRSIGIRDLRFSGPVRDSETKFPEPIGTPATSVSYDSVQIAADGKVYGQINLLDDRTGLIREVLSMRVFFLKDGKVVAANRVASNGGFSVTGLSPGIHSLVGVGRDGIFAIGIEVLPFKAADKREEAVPVSLLVTMEVAVAPVTAQNINVGNFSDYFGQAPGITPGVPGAPGTAPGGAPATAPTGGSPTGTGTAGAAGGAGAGLGGAVAGGVAGALGGAVLGDLLDASPDI